MPGEEGVAEYDSYLEEAAGAILPPLAALAGGEMFLTKFEPILPRLLKKLVHIYHELTYFTIKYSSVYFFLSFFYILSTIFSLVYFPCYFLCKPSVVWCVFLYTF